MHTAVECKLSGNCYLFTEGAEIVFTFLIEWNKAFLYTYIVRMKYCIQYYNSVWICYIHVNDVMYVRVYDILTES